METDSTTTAPRSKLRWFQYSLRTFLIVVTLLAIGASLLMRYVHQCREVVRLEKEAVAEIEKLGGKIGYGAVRTVLAEFPEWLRTLLGDEVYRPVDGAFLGRRRITDNDLKHISQFGELRLLWLFDTQITDVGLQYLSQLKKLQVLTLDNTSVTDSGLKHLSQLIALRTLRLNSTQITDDGLNQLSKLPSLTWLEAKNTQITDIGLQHLSKLTGLQKLALDETQITDLGIQYLSNISSLDVLSLNDTQITDVGLKKLIIALPKCQTKWSPVD